MSEYGTTAEGRPLGKDRSPLAVVLLSIITLGIYYLVWYYKINREMRDHDERIEVRPGLAVLAQFVPIVNWVSAFNTAKRLQQIQAMEGVEPTASPGLALVLLIFTVGIGYPAYLASLLRRHWQMHREGAPAIGYSAYQALPQGQYPATQGLPAAAPTGYMQQPSGYLPQVAGYGQQSGEYGQQPAGYGQQPAGYGQEAYHPQAAQHPAETAAPVEQLSPDGRYRWDGYGWQPVAQQAPPPAPAPVPVPAPVPAPAEQLSPDGRYRWDGYSWQPVEHQAPPPAPVEQLSPDGRYRWDGYSWQPVQQ